MREAANQVVGQVSLKWPDGITNEGGEMSNITTYSLGR